MRLLEYKSKELLIKYCINVPNGELVKSDTNFEHPVILKAQIATVGRQRKGGVLLVKSNTEFIDAVAKLNDITIAGLKSEGILMEEIISFEKELYFSLGINTNTAQIELLAKYSGGINTEDSEEDIFTAVVSDSNLVKIANSLCAYYGYDSNYENLFSDFLEAILKCMIKSDLLLLEINPLVISDQKLIALDCKAEFDDNARYRHPEYRSTPLTTNFVLLNQAGNTAIFANGAGLAMATVDEVQRAGLVATNFLDIGGGADSDKMKLYFDNISKFTELRAIIINVFAGITRCDDVAQAVVDACRTTANLPPLYIRLYGNGFEDAKNILDEAGISLYDNLEDCIKAVSNA